MSGTGLPLRRKEVDVRIGTLMRLILLLFAAVLAWIPGAAQTPAPDSVCADCHEVREKVSKSAHTGVACSSCHPKHEAYPHPEKLPKPACSNCHQAIVGEYDRSVHAREVRSGNEGAPNCAFCHGESHEIKVAKNPEFRHSVPETCGMCHDKELTEFKTSIHGKDFERGLREAPVCTDCHSAHSIDSPSRPSSTVSSAHIPDTCGRCHGDLKLMQRFGLNTNQVVTFKDSFHGLALRSGQQSVADCASCHGYHTILPSTDKRSSIHPSNIAKTCGSCHPGAGTKFSLGRVHEVSAKDRPELIRYAQIFYLLLIPGTIGFMAIHHLGDYCRKMYAMRFRGMAMPTWMLKPVEPTFRMHRMERILHFLLAASFITLAYTGFALHYPDEWWSRPMLHWERNFPVRGTVHRTAGVILVVTGVIHFVTIIVNRRLREHWLELIPRYSDLREMVEGTLWRLGLRKKRPHISPHSYIEKAEYWALVWGTAVMAVTGALLWANNWTLKFLPKVWMDLSRTVHYYEAVLATLAILVWHFYSVILDPEVYPMDPAWITGYSPRQFEGGHAHPETGEKSGD